MANNKQVNAKSGGKRRRPPVVRERPPRAPSRKKPRLVDDGEQFDGGEQCDDNFEILEVMQQRGDDGRGMRKQEGSLRENSRLEVDCDDSNADAGRGEVEDDVVWSREEDFECERIGWGEIDAEGEDRLLLRSVAEALQWRLKLREWMTDLARLIQSDG